MTLPFDIAGKHLHFVTGRLADPALRKTVANLAGAMGFRYSIQTMPITVAALMTPDWIAARITVPDSTDAVVIPGYAKGDLSKLGDKVHCLVICGPRDLRDLGSFLGGKSLEPDLTRHDIEIIAEINEAPRLAFSDVLCMARHFASSGADIIDVGCLPGEVWRGVGDCVRGLRDEGFRVSVDSLNPFEIAAATRAGAELVLSVNSTNREQAIDWGATVVVIPDMPGDWRSLEANVEFLSGKGIRFRIDPILEPIGFGFAASLFRYFRVRERWPDAEMMMGIGNLTELSDVDSAGVNFLLMAICQELRIGSVLTTEVINWARSSVKECDIARRIVKYAIDEQAPPKNLSRDLIALRDHRLVRYGREFFAAFAQQVKDRNYRIFAEDGTIHAMAMEDYFFSEDPFKLFDAMVASHPRNLDPSHAFYLGYEFCKAELANILGKQYVQDEPLSWGHLTPEHITRHRIKRRRQDNDSTGQGSR